MMLTSSLPLLPPPPASLLPALNPPASETSFHSQQHPHPHLPHHHRRQKHAPNPRSTLSMLAADERSIASRKLAIAMYGYSWLKPAGCTKTMLGRREEEVEREEVERQLREVEAQERMAIEAEEQERLARLQEGGEPEGERDLDDEVPEEEDGSDGEEGMEGDLDDDIADADAEASEGSGIEEGWVYDTRREPDTDEEGEMESQVGFVPNRPPVRPMRRGSDGGVDEREVEDLANEMLDEDEMGDMDFDQDDEMGGVRDLDDDVPEADQGGWEHTDSELESEMDISILPGQVSMRGARRSSGLPSSIGRSGARVVSGNMVAGGNAHATTDAQRRVQMQTPQLSSDLMGPDSTGGDEQRGSGTRRSWLQGASARRNLFGIGRSQQQHPASGRFFTPSPAQRPSEESPEAEEDQSRRRSGRFLGRRRGAWENRDSVD